MIKINHSKSLLLTLSCLLISGMFVYKDSNAASQTIPNIDPRDQLHTQNKRQRLPHSERKAAALRMKASYQAYHISRIKDCVNSNGCKKTGKIR
jgi:hypothetical protein